MAIVIEPVDPRKFATFTEFILGAADDNDRASIVGSHLTVFNEHLAFGEGAKKKTLEATGQKLGITRERVRQIAKRISGRLFGGGNSAKYQLLCDAVTAIFDAANHVIKSEELPALIDAEFGWHGTTLDNLVSFMGFFGHRIELNEYGWCGIDLMRHGVKLPVPTPIGELRRKTLLSVLQTAGPKGLTLAEMLRRCNEACPAANFSIDVIRGLIGNRAELDNHGTRIVGYDRGNNANEASTFSLNSFFSADREILEEAGWELKSYMDRTGFGTVSIWKVWRKYRPLLPVDLPKLGFYMMLRDTGAAGLVYQAYPRTTHPDADYCEAAFQWEIYQYFMLSDHPVATYRQVLDFLVECLQLDPVIANSSAIPGLRLKSTGEKSGGDELYEIPMPKMPDGKIPGVLLSNCRPDPALPFLQPRRRGVNLKKHEIDEYGRAKTVLVYVRLFFFNLQESRYRFTADEWAELTDAGWCAKHFGVHVPVVVKVKPTIAPPSLNYWSEPFDFGGELAWVCSNWNAKRKELFDVWAVKIAAKAGLDFEPYAIG